MEEEERDQNERQRREKKEKRTGGMEGFFLRRSPRRSGQFTELLPRREKSSGCRETGEKEEVIDPNKPRLKLIDPLTFAPESLFILIQTVRWFPVKGKKKEMREDHDEMMISEPDLDSGELTSSSEVRFCRFLSRERKREREVRESDGDRRQNTP